MYLEPNLPQALCVSCGATVVNSYLFRRLCEYSNKKWAESLNKLEETLCQIDLINPNTKTAYLLMNDQLNLTFTSKKSKDKSDALSRIKRIMTSKAKYQKLKLKSIVCEECGNKFSTLQVLTKHLRKHHDIPVRIPCPQCAKYFATPLQLQDHEERVHYPKKIQCQKCPKMFGSIKMLRRHEKKSHIAVICKLCFMQLPSREALQAHLDKHVDNVCQKCNKTYSNKQTFAQHKKICGIKAVPKYICDICSKMYARKNGIRSHLKVDHGFGKVLSCNWCSKKFDVISRLKMHVVKHTKERTFFCEHCGGKFVTKAALVYHTRLHTGERPFPCDLCPESFLSASRRMEHKRRKHFEPTKECTICHAKFTSKFQLSRHVQRHYNPQSKLFITSLQTDKVFDMFGI